MITPILKVTQKITWHVTNVTIGTYLASTIMNDVKKDTSFDKEIEHEDIDKADLNVETKVRKNWTKTSSISRKCRLVSRTKDLYII